ncbi:MAG TPA: sulfotransferase [Acidimicrobiales bacterium]|nr:sulfotransferase [Acidimicrobiales bacterium]
MTAAVKVVYVLGTQRGGTTIAGRLLGAVPGVAFVGELRRLWEIGPDGARRCGCGATHRQCPVWAAVLPAVFDGGPPRDEVRRWQRLVSSRYSSAVQLCGMRRTSGNFESAWRSYGELLASTYLALAEATGARVVVDSSKLPTEGGLVADIDGIEASLVHLVRDPRAVAYSLVRRSEGSAMAFGAHPRQTLSGSVTWLARHGSSAAVCRPRVAGRSLVARYESMATDPNAFVRSVMSLIDEPAPATDIVEDGVFRSGPDHTPTGGGRFASAQVELRRDDRWKASLAPADRLLATAVTLPLAHRYGYRPAKA